LYRYGKYISWNRTEKQFEKVTLEDIRGYAKKYLVNPQVFVLGDIKNIPAKDLV